MNGTLKITNVKRNDSGQYSIEVFNSNGVQEKNIVFTLDVKENGKVEGTEYSKILQFCFCLLFLFAGLETCCDIKQHGAQCYGSLGGNVDIQLMDNTSKTSKYQLMKNSLKILNVRNNKVLPNAEGQRFVFFSSNATYRIPNMSRNDSGNYTLQTFDSEGRASGEWTLQLFIQAPVSSVLLVSECLSQGEMRVSCSSEGGDSPQYSWTLNARTLTDAELLPGNNETNIITLKQHVSGNLVCSVRNNVSNVSKEQRISTCGVETYCDDRQDGARCYGALGGTADIQLVDSTSKIPRYKLLKNLLKILDVRNNKVISNIIQDRSVIFPCNGTFRLSDLSRNDSGNYTLQTFDSDGTSTGEQTLQLFIQAPVSSVLLVSECLSQGERRVSCFSEGGDSPRYSWTLDGRTLTDAELLSGDNESYKIILKQHITGHLVCSVWNNVSNVSKEERKYLSVVSVETYCDGRQDGAQCYGAFGGTVNIQLMNNTSEITRYQLLKDSLKILDVKGDKVISNNIAHRYLIFPSNGTFRINGLSRTDIGKYTLQTFDSDGRTSDVWTLHLFIQGVETYCDGRQDDAQCYGALGGTVDIQLVNSTSEIPRYYLLKDSLKILDVRGNKAIYNTIAHKSLILPSNGTFRISDLSRTDSGNYSLITFDSDGRSSGEQTLQLLIQAPVSSVLLVSECLSQGERRVSCSSEGGDSPQYSWTLDGRTLTDAELLPGNNETNIITLKHHISGHLVCSVKNNVNSVSKEQEISTCVEVSYLGRRLKSKRALMKSMEQFLIIVLVAGEIHGMGTYCDGSQDETKCYGALGGTVDIHLGSISEILEYQLLKDSLKIFNVKKTMISFKTKEHRYLFLSNGTFRINNLSRSDSDNYTLQAFDSDGRRSDQRILQLFIQAPVSSVLLVSECLSQGERRVSCSSEGGDSPQYSWTLDGRTLTDAELLSVNNESNIITLKQHISGHLVCSVRNNVSNVSKEERISTCGAGILTLMGGVLLALIVFLVLVSECLSQGEMRMSCSSEGGDSPQYSWTLNGHTLTDAELLSENNETNIITLKHHISGHLVCSVKNNVNSVSKEQEISTCVE
ncbi:hemicentin-1-like [Neolamprologus brichardi]|uniref:hemicentin-1-like n=1 Tax=Neolamprologus brichardi TaxID=32507 RepID=UPI00164389C8|nr:hemicentin-1-like [Neolamprologus brichardi]